MQRAGRDFRAGLICGGAAAAPASMAAMDLPAEDCGVVDWSEYALFSAAP